MQEPSNYNQAEPSYDDKEIIRLENENREKQSNFDKQRKIEQLKMESQRLDSQKKEMYRKFNPRFEFTKEKAKFWAVAVVVAITVSIIVVKIAQKLF